MNLAELSNVLWRQRQLLDQLLFRLTVEQMLMSDRQLRWLNWAMNAVEDVLAALRECDVVRSMVLIDIAEELGLAHDATLQEISAAAGGAWSDIFEDHRRAFLEMTDEVRALVEANHLWIGHRSGAPLDLFEEYAFEAALSSAVARMQPSLADFLR